MNECSKAVVRRMHDPAFMLHYFSGHGIDIGAGRDSLHQYIEFFPNMRSCLAWDVDDGDAQEMPGVSDYNFDFVHSSHCLEHLVDPYRALQRWLAILRPGGYLVCIVPDEDLYEQGVWPSTFNADHKHTFTINKSKSWSPVSINIFDLLRRDDISIQHIKLLSVTNRTLLGGKRYDQTLTPVGESAIEFVVRKE
jgi:SAM-dependent methyltransferase